STSPLDQISSNRKEISTQQELKFFDEVRVDHTNLGEVFLWSRRGDRPTVEHFKSQIYESWTIIVLTMLDQHFPITFRLISGFFSLSFFLSFIFVVGPTTLERPANVVRPND